MVGSARAGVAGCRVDHSGHILVVCHICSAVVGSRRVVDVAGAVVAARTIFARPVLFRCWLHVNWSLDFIFV